MGAHRRALQMVLEALRARGQWPRFAEVDRRLDREGIDLADLLPDLVPGSLHRDGSGVVPQPDERLRLTVAGLNRCDGKEHERDLFLRTLQWIVQRERDYDPAAGQPSEPTVTSNELADALQLAGDSHSNDLAIVFALLNEESELTSGAYGPSEDGVWSISLPRRLRRYRSISSVDEYLLQKVEANLQAGLTVNQDWSWTATDQTSDMEDERRPPPDRRKVFVVHGRDREARNALFSFLRDLDLHPLEWEELVAATGSTSPFTGQVVAARAFTDAQAVVVLFTPDDEARLHASLHQDDEPEHETELTGQARPNVLLEAGMALGANPDRTILVELGRLRPVSDLAGRNVVRLGSTNAPLNALAHRLEAAGCQVNRANPAWMDPARFAALAARSRQAEDSKPPTGELPRGYVLPRAAPVPAPPRLSARLHDRGRDNLLEVVNRGGITLREVRWELPPDAKNWAIFDDVLPKYPIPELPPREHVRVPAAVTMGGPVMIDVTLIATTPEGEPYRTTARLSVYD
jgi:predicted nucleotide-binding protein